ncbi:MAG: SLBB domain-containing protein [bacterium]
MIRPMIRFPRRARTRRLAFGPALAAALALVAAAAAQDGQSAAAGRSAGSQALVGVESPIISEEYILMPGDELLVTVSGPVTYSYRSFVTYEGKVTVNMPPGMSPFVADRALPDEVGNVVDAVRISGLTMQRAQDTLACVMKRYFRDTEVKLTLLGLRSGIIFVTGEVQYAGAYNASSVERVSQLVAKAGGLAPLGSRSRIHVIRGGRLHAVADIGRFETEGDLMANPFVESGDVIFVPPVEGLVTVKGAVFGRGSYRLRTSALTTEKERISEGIYELEPGDRVFDMIRKAGGITPWADLAYCYVDRIILGGRGARKRMPVDLHAILFQADSAQNLPLMNSDILVIPPINTLVYVEGEVQSPGAFLYTPNLRASDYIGQASGPTHYATMRGAHLIRDGRRLSLRDDPTVDPGDRIVVPRVALRWWQDYVSIISAIGIPVASVIISFYALSR